MLKEMGQGYQRFLLYSKAKGRMGWKETQEGQESPLL